MSQGHEGLLVESSENSPSATWNRSEGHSFPIDGTPVCEYTSVTREFMVAIEEKFSNAVDSREDRSVN